MSTPPKPTVKQLREQKRQEQLERFRKQEAARKRNRVLGIVGAVTALVLIAGGVTAAIVVSLQPQATPPTAIAGDYEERVQRYENLSGNHTETAVNYDQTPPVGGPHNPAWLNCGVYNEPQVDEYAVHSLEHGAVWIAYDPGFTTDDEIAALIELAPDTYSIIAPYPGIGEAKAISAWGAQLRFIDVDDPAVQNFIDEYWRSAEGPEPNAPCTGAITGPGLVS